MNASNVTHIRDAKPVAAVAVPKPRELRSIAVADIWIDPATRLRDVEDLDEEGVGPLAKSLQRVRQIEPIVVAEETEAKCPECQRHDNAACSHDTARRKFRLYVGERRLAATRLTGAATIEAIIDDSLRFDPVRAEDVPLHENVERIDHSVWQFYREVVKRRQRNPGESLAVLAERTDLSVPFLEDCERIHAAVAPELVGKLRADARSETFRHLAQAARIEGVTLEDRHKAQRAWWAVEGWRRPGKASQGRGKGAGGASGSRAPRRPSAREVERMARRIEDDRVVEADGERAELGARAAKIVAALLRAVALPRTAPVGSTDDTGTMEGGAA